MTPALLATCLFALSSVAAKRSVSLLGSSTANLLRILLAALVLGVYAHTFGAGLHGVALGWFLLSGFIGYGICDTALFLTLPLLGAQLTMLMIQCLAAPLAAVTEWLWLGTRLGLGEILAGLTILAGVALALFPGRGKTPAAHPGARAFALGFIAAAGQAIGAVLSRHGQSLAKEAGQPLDGLSVAYQRILAGVAFTLVWWFWQRGRTPPDSRWRAPLPSLASSRLTFAPGSAGALPHPPAGGPELDPASGPNPVGRRSGGALRVRDLLLLKARREPHPTTAPSPWRRAWPWVLVNALSGPSLGVACYQWAFQLQPTGVVMSITALTPLAVIPLAWWLDGERPTRRSMLGGGVAVAGAVWLAAHR